MFIWAGGDLGVVGFAFTFGISGETDDRDESTVLFTVVIIGVCFVHGYFDWNFLGEWLLVRISLSSAVCWTHFGRTCSLANEYFWTDLFDW